MCEILDLCGTGGIAAPFVGNRPWTVVVNPGMVGDMLQCAYLSSTSRDPIVLVWGTDTDLQRLSGMLAELSVTSRSETIGDQNSPNRVAITINDAARGMHWDGSTLRWQVSAADAGRFAVMVAELASQGEPRHNYLDCASASGIEVKVSLNEYPADFRP